MSYQAPIGSPEEIATGRIWPGRWFDATPYLSHYAQGYHTGADLNLNYPFWDADKHSKVFAMGSGKVTYAKLYSTKYWGNIIVIDHGIVDGLPLFSRYGHVDKIRVAKDQVIEAGTHIANVGNGEGLFPYHLHFDISRTDILSGKPWHWPGENISMVREHYVNPKEWLQMHAVAGVAPIIPPSELVYVIATQGLRVRLDHSTSAKQVGSILYGAHVSLEPDRVEQDTYTWGRITGGMYDGDWMAVGMTDHSDIFISVNPPGQ